MGQANFVVQPMFQACWASAAGISAGSAAATHAVKQRVVLGDLQRLAGLAERAPEDGDRDVEAFRMCGTGDRIGQQRRVTRRVVGGLRVLGHHDAVKPAPRPVHQFGVRPAHHTPSPVNPRLNPVCAGAGAGSVPLPRHRVKAAGTGTLATHPGPCGQHHFLVPISLTTCRGQGSGADVNFRRGPEPLTLARGHGTTFYSRTSRLRTGGRPAPEHRNRRVSNLTSAPGNPVGPLPQPPLTCPQAQPPLTRAIAKTFFLA
jgi:hypothetical protein